MLAALAVGAPQPTDHTLVYYNARMALREGQPTEAVKLWLLRNTLEDLTGAVSAHDADFRSVTWAATGAAGICQDGYPEDDDGAGLWPIALHNWVVRSMGRRGRPRKPRPFAAFDLGRQQRVVSLHDALSAQELLAVRLFRGPCLRHRTEALEAGLPVRADLYDRQHSARLLRHLLERARDTLAADQVRGTAAIEARLFDLDLQLTALAAREARNEARERARRGRVQGLSKGSIAAMQAQAPTTTLPPDSEAARILRASVAWPVSEWMRIEPERRLFLFEHARAYNDAPGAMDRIALGVIDALIEQGDGADLERWIAHRGEGGGAHADIWGGERGQRLLALEREAGFRERAVIALHRGVHDLERGELPGSMRAMAFALQHADDSRDADTVRSLSRRWLSYVAAQFETSDELLITLQALVPRRDYGVILEDLMWHAAFRADGVSFSRGVRNQAGRGALERRLRLLEPLAVGALGRFEDGIAEGLQRSPSETLRFLHQLVQRLELEDGAVRKAQLPTLARLDAHLQALASDPEKAGRRGRSAAALLGRMQAIQEGLAGLAPDAGPEARARALAPSGEVYAGSVRLAPVDPIPWPFHASEVPAPSVFTPLQLTPVEWRDDGGQLVFGWSIDG
jgi:hypothetical protein